MRPIARLSDWVRMQANFDWFRSPVLHHERGRPVYYEQAAAGVFGFWASGGLARDARLGTLEDANPFPAFGAGWTDWMGDRVLLIRRPFHLPLRLLQWWMRVRWLAHRWGRAHGYLEILDGSIRPYWPHDPQVFKWSFLRRD